MFGGTNGQEVYSYNYQFTVCFFTYIRTRRKRGLLKHPLSLVAPGHISISEKKLG